jgi:hypothetical protein
MKMKSICHILVLVGMLAQYSMAGPSSPSPEQTTLVHLRDTATPCYMPDLWKRDLEKYLQVHNVYICTATNNAEVQTWDTNHRPYTNYRQAFAILRDLRGTRAGEVKASYRILNDLKPLSKGDKVIVLGHYCGRRRENVVFLAV